MQENKKGINVNMAKKMTERKRAGERQRKTTTSVHIIR